MDIPPNQPQNLEEREGFGSHNSLISELEKEEQSRKVFLEELTSWMQEIGKAITKMPVMGYKELDLYQFYKEVQNNGGFAQVTEKVGTWSKIWKKLDNYDASITDASFRLKKNYERFLLDFEYKCYPERRQQQKVKPPKGKRSRSNSGSKDKMASQQFARQQQQNIEAALYQVKQLEAQQKLESRQLQEVQQMHQLQETHFNVHQPTQQPVHSGHSVHHPVHNPANQAVGQPAQQPNMNLEVHLPMNDVEVIEGQELIFDEDLFRLKLDNEVKNLLDPSGYVDPFSPKVSKKVKPEFPDSMGGMPDESMAPNPFDGNYVDDHWGFNTRCAFGEDKKYSDEWNLSETSSLF